MEEQRAASHIDKGWEVLLQTRGFLGSISGSISHFRGVNSDKNIAIKQGTRLSLNAGNSGINGMLNGRNVAAVVFAVGWEGWVLLAEGAGGSGGRCCPGAAPAPQRFLHFHGIQEIFFIFF